MSIEGSSSTALTSAVSTPCGRRTPRSVVMSRSATRTNSTGTPTRLRIRALFCVRIFATPVPTVSNPALVLDQREPHVLVPAFPEADPGRDGHLGVPQQQLRKLKRSHPPVGS